MASLAQMKSAAAGQGAQAPPDYPGGPDAWVRDWYQNAVNAGSIQDPSTPFTQGQATATDATTGATPQGRMNTGTSQFADMVRKKARDEGWSEDFARFSDAQLEAWKPYWDEGAGKFRSEQGQAGFFEKPTECAPGTTMHGSKCVPWSSLPPELGGTLGQGGGAQPGAPAAPGGAAFNPNDPLQSQLVNLFQERGGMFAGQGGQFGESLSGGGIWTGSNNQAGVNPALTQAALTAFTPAAPSQQAAPKPAAAAAPAVNSAYMSGITGMGTGGLPQPVGTPPPQPQMATAPSGGGPLNKALAGAYRDPNQWWKGKPQVA